MTAGAKRKLGPSLDELKPEEGARAPGASPGRGPEDIAAVARYVAENAR